MDKRIYYVYNKTYNNDVVDICTSPTGRIQCFKYSDHLPVFTKITIEGISFIIGSFNVMFQRRIDDNTHIKKLQRDFQGYLGINFKYLTQMTPTERINGIMKTIYNLFRLYQIDILGLQEFNIDDLPQLKETLHKICCDIDAFDYIIPSDISTFSSCTRLDEQKLTAMGMNDMQIVIYRKSKLKHNIKLSKLTYYQTYDKTGHIFNKINRRIMDVSFSINELLPYNRDQEFRFINTHVHEKQTNILSQYLYDISKPTFYTCKPYSIVIVGDMETEIRPVIQLNQSDTSNVIGVTGATGTNISIPFQTGVIVTGPTGPCNLSYYGPTGFMGVYGPISTLPIVGENKGFTGTCDYGNVTIISSKGTTGFTGPYMPTQPNPISLLVLPDTIYNTYLELSGTPDPGTSLMVPGDKPAIPLDYTTINANGKPVFYDHIWFRIT